MLHELLNITVDNHVTFPLCLMNALYANSKIQMPDAGITPKSLKPYLKPKKCFNCEINLYDDLSYYNFLTIIVQYLNLLIILLFHAFLQIRIDILSFTQEYIRFPNPFRRNMN
ncbi:hypothetical protein BpHYR1_018865 [Brachionus plicatilis]|uniref:Uncharacterized protein n=1 Tax=Brachionus plicatilis TaxID=10195 RepID=A0A3M7PLG3_BRAPC|nr:hypothetical protein BpHYR1_018865 [Brachionus plicatilis]